MWKRMIIIPVVVSLLPFLGCSKYKVAKFVMPTWDTQLSAPIFDRTYTLGEILYKDSVMASHGDTTFLNPVGSSGLFSLLRTQSIDTVKFAGKLKIGSASMSYAQTDSALNVGQTGPVPPIPQETPILSSGTTFQDFDSATISSGTLVVSITNRYPAAIILSNFISIIDPSDNRTIISIPVPSSLAPNQTITTSQSLEGITLPNNPEVTFTYSSPGSTNPTTIQTDTVVSATFNILNAVASSVSGRVHLGSPITFNTNIVKVDLGDFKSKFSGGVTFGSSTGLMLNINLTGGFPDSVHLVLIPSNSAISSGTIDSAVVDAMVLPKQTNLINFGPSFVKALNEYSMATNSIPDEFIISGYAIVNPGPPYVYGTVTNKDEVDGMSTFFMPLDIGIINGAFVDTTSKTVFDSTASAKMENVDTVKIVFEVSNGLPLKLSLRTQLVDTLTNDTSYFASVNVNQASVDPGTGQVIAPQLSTSPVILTGSQAEKLGRSYMRFEYDFSTPPAPQQVPFNKDNTVSLKVYGNMIFKVDKGTFK